MARIPKNYQGKNKTSRNLQDLLPRLLKKVNEVHAERGDIIIPGWSKVIGEKLAPMARAVAFKEGVLYVKVNNSTLFSLLCEHEKPRLLYKLRKQFPSCKIVTIKFQMG